MQAAPAAAGSGSAVKIVLIIVGAMVLLGAMSIGGLVYAGYRAKQKFTELRHQYAGDTVPTATLPAANPRTFPPSKGSGCRWLEGQEAAGILGVAVDRVEAATDAHDDSESCSYWVNPAERRRLMQAEIAAGISEVGKGDAGSTSGFEKTIGGALGVLIEANGDNRNSDAAFVLQLWHRNGRAMWEKTESAKASVKNAAGVDLVGAVAQNVAGVGDRAMVLPGGHSIMVQKGDSFFVIGFQQFVPGREKTAALAQAVAGRIP
jgi:hypothetical protein